MVPGPRSSPGIRSSSPAWSGTGRALRRGHVRPSSASIAWACAASSWARRWALPCPDNWRAAKPMRAAGARSSSRCCRPGLILLPPGTVTLGHAVICARSRIRGSGQCRGRQDLASHLRRGREARRRADRGRCPWPVACPVSVPGQRVIGRRRARAPPSARHPGPLKGLTGTERFPAQWPALACQEPDGRIQGQLLACSRMAPVQDAAQVGDVVLVGVRSPMSSMSRPSRAIW